MTVYSDILPVPQLCAIFTDIIEGIPSDMPDKVQHRKLKCLRDVISSPLFEPKGNCFCWSTWMLFSRQSSTLRTFSYMYMYVTASRLQTVSLRHAVCVTECQEVLLPLCISEVITHIEGQQEVRQCAEILGDLLIALHSSHSEVSGFFIDW